MSSEIRLKRLKYRSGHRGCKETDLILSRFAEDRLEAMGAPMVDLYEQFLEENDVDIWNWLIGAYPPANPAYLPILELLKSYADDEA
jgi:antitoxin CptB